LKLIPLAAILGATSLTFADLLARAAVQPYELPVGAVTALLGAPAFLWIMLRRVGGAGRIS
jgi:iron complex transport system permease protein